MYDYPNAGVNAPPDVVRAIEKFDRLPDDKKEFLPLLWFLLGEQSTQAFKMSKGDARYKTHSDSKACCGNCKFAYASLYEKRHVCSQMAGTIHERAVCKLWEG